MMMAVDPGAPGAEPLGVGTEGFIIPEESLATYWIGNGAQGAREDEIDTVTNLIITEGIRMGRPDEVP